MIRKLSVIVTLCLIAFNTAAQTENTGWLFISHTQKLNKNFDVLADLQLRSSDQFNDFSALLFRTALNYNINKKHAVAFGYTFLGKWERDEMQMKILTPENRIYQQYLFSFNTRRTEWNLRFRLEQRFVNQEARTDFSQRARAFIAAQIPIAANADFTKGFYAGVQNELFLTIQNKDNVNGHIFDQNRSLASLG
ncbi:DUF2490 domain-containing protein [Pedobacter sp. N23S346]|uniref:DUF2490 domain-containing protein n=1 Tax=Pedobacter sp. N23S346 TaxID=3402750 RepID=UPI003ACE6F06